MKITRKQLRQKISDNSLIGDTKKFKSGMKKKLSLK